jgi:hypothetical protein
MTTENSCGDQNYNQNPCGEIPLPGLGISNMTSTNYNWNTGVTGQVLTVGSNNIPSWTSSYTIPGVPSEEEFKNLMDRMVKIEERLAILEPNQELQDKYPALQEAYEAYKIIEKLVHDPKK